MVTIEDAGERCRIGSRAQYQLRIGLG